MSTVLMPIYALLLKLIHHQCTMLISAGLWLLIIFLSSCQGRSIYYDTDADTLSNWKDEAALEDLEDYDNFDSNNVEIKSHDPSGIREEDLFEGDLVVSQDLINAFYGRNTVSE